MRDRTFYLGWQDPSTRGWFPVGRLDANAKRDEYRYAYTKGALAAQEKSGFEPLYDFPKFDETYRSDHLFPMFRNRIMTSGRRGFDEYLKLLDLDESSAVDPLEILAIDGGYRATDHYEVFQKIERRENGAFRCRFFLHGWRHTTDQAKARLMRLNSGERLNATIELTNPSTGLAVQIQSEDYHMLGWAPRYLLEGLMHAMAGSPGDFSAKVVQINPMPAPSKQRVLIEFTGHWLDDYSPMESEEFQLLTQ